jgi:hypothetical protein
MWQIGGRDIMTNRGKIVYPLQKRGDKNDLSACQNIAYKLDIPPYINHINVI